MNDRPLDVMRPGRHVLAGTVSEPHFSSVAKGWRGVMLELFAGASDFTAIFENHGICVHLNGCVKMHQRFEGKVANTQMRRGNVVVSPAGVPKRFQYSDGGDILVVHIAQELFLRVAEEMKRGNPGDVELLHNFCTRDRQIERLALQLWDEFQTEDLASGICAESLGNQFAVHLLRNYSTLARHSQPSPNRLSVAAHKRALDYIESNLANDLTIGEIARALSMSAGHFAHAFKSTTGIAPHRYVMERRIELAKSLLRETDLPISNVATRVGFSTHSHFCVTFQKVTAETPSTFRRKL
jgi:AraC family transcriptional regulator